jgi:hypothetical protein
MLCASKEKEQLIRHDAGTAKILKSKELSKLVRRGSDSCAWESSLKSAAGVKLLSKCLICWRMSIWTGVAEDEVCSPCLLEAVRLSE